MEKAVQKRPREDEPHDDEIPEPKKKKKKLNFQYDFDEEVVQG